MLSILVGGWDSGWTAYPPLSLKGAVGYQFMFWAIFAIGLSSILGSLNLIATMLLMRPKGMSTLPHADLLLGRAGHQFDPADRYAVYRHRLPDDVL